MYVCEGRMYVECVVHQIKCTCVWLLLGMCDGHDGVF